VQVGAPAPIFRSIARLSAPGLALAAFQTAVSIADTHFVGRLGTEPLAGLALVFPLVMLLQMASAGAMGGGVSSAIARARGGGNEAAARRLVVHALVIALAAGLLFTLVFLLVGRPLYALLGGGGETLAQAIAYSDILFGGAALVWLANTFAASLRGGGSTAIPAAALAVAALIQVPLSGALTLGWGPFPALGIRGAALAYAASFGLAAAIMGACVWAGALRPREGDWRLEGRLFREILRVGALSSISALQTVAAAIILTGCVGTFGTAALAGYGVGVRLELLQVPIVFAIGQALVILVGTHIGAGQAPRARRIAWAGTLAAVSLCLVQRRRRRARRRQPLPAHRRAVLPVLRRRHGALLRRAGRRAGRPADPRRHGAPGGGRRGRTARGVERRAALLAVRGHRIRHGAVRRDRGGGSAPHALVIKAGARR